MKYVFLLNVFTLKNNTFNIVNRIENFCREKKFDFIIEINSKEYSTEDILKKYKNSRIIIIPVGGDGIINRTLNCIINTDNILGFIPYGTGNDLYRSVKEQFFDGINQCDVVKVNKRYFINVMCFGIDSDIANTKNKFNFRFIPKSQRYNVGIIYNFFKYKNKYFEVHINGEKIRDNYVTIIVCNGSYYGRGYYVSPNSKLNNNSIDVLLAPKMNKLSMIKLILSMKKGKHLNSKKISIFNTNKLEVISNKKCLINIDGEELFAKKFNIEVLTSKLQLYYNQEMIDAIRN